VAVLVAVLVISYQVCFISWYLVVSSHQLLVSVY